jgi:hypothetical protein
MKLLIALEEYDDTALENAFVLMNEPFSMVLIPVIDKESTCALLGHVLENGIPHRLYVTEIFSWLEDLIEEADELGICKEPLKSSLAMLGFDDSVALVWDETSTVSVMVGNYSDDIGFTTFDVSLDISSLDFEDEEEEFVEEPIDQIDKIVEKVLDRMAEDRRFRRVRRTS